MPKLSKSKTTLKKNIILLTFFTAPLQALKNFLIVLLMSLIKDLLVIKLKILVTSYYGAGGKR